MCFFETVRQVRSRCVVSENMIHNTEEHDSEIAIIFAEEQRKIMQQESALADYLQIAVMLVHNKREVE